MTTDALAARVAEKLGWENRRYTIPATSGEFGIVYFEKDNPKKVTRPLQKNDFSSESWEDAGLVEAALWERGIELKVGREGRRWWWTVLIPQPGQPFKRVSCPIAKRLDHGPTAIFAAALQALGGE